MEKQFLSRQHLESFSTQDLVALADDYGIDIPENLNRRFIIEEILDSVEEMENVRIANEDVVYTDGNLQIASSLPTSYNETRINALFHDPAWVFVFWDISTADLDKLKNEASLKNLFLHVVFFDSETAETPSDTMDIRISHEDRMQYLLLPSSKRYFVIDLACNAGTPNLQVLAYTERMKMPEGSPLISSMQPGKKVDMAPLIKLSGMEELLREHYLQHREAFNNR